MTKVCEKEFPLGSFKGQKTDGFYIDGTLKVNLDTLADKIADDQQFNLLITGSGSTRVGKSFFCTQVASYLTSKVNELHKTKNVFTLKNMVFKSEDLIKKALNMPKYSVLVLDEGDDLVEHYWSKLSRDLRRFFRKCGQLNIFVILVLPDFFELPKTYAITRTICLLDVHFVRKFERGYFSFYNFKKKRSLYLKGRKYADYDMVSSNFRGRFINFCTINQEDYRKKKWNDLQEGEKEDTAKTYSQIVRETEQRLFNQLYLNLKISVKKLSLGFGISPRSGARWLSSKEKVTEDKTE